jgi:hypothetical protein
MLLLGPVRAQEIVVGVNVVNAMRASVADQNAVFSAFLLSACVALYWYYLNCVVPFLSYGAERGLVPPAWNCAPPRRKWLVSLFSIIGDFENSVE